MIQATIDWFKTPAGQFTLFTAVKVVAVFSVRLREGQQCDHRNFPLPMRRADLVSAHDHRVQRGTGSGGVALRPGLSGIGAVAGVAQSWVSTL